MRYAFYSHGGCENHGCEAIVRTLSAMIKKGQPESVIKLYTLNAGSDEAGDLPNIDETEEFDYIRPVSKTTSAQMFISRSAAITIATATVTWRPLLTES